MKTLKDLLDERSVLMNRAATEAAAGDVEKRDLNSTEFAAWQATMDQIREMDTLIAQKRSLEDFARSRAASVGTGAEGNRDVSKQDQRDLAGFNLNRALLAKMDQRSLDGVEAEVHQIGEARAKEDGIKLQGNSVIVMEEFIQKRGQTVTGQTTNAGDQGGVLVEKQMQGILGLMLANTFLTEVGAHVITGLSSDLVFPTIDTAPAIQELTEIEAGTDSEILFGSFEMKPVRRFTNVPISRQLLIQSSIDVQNEVISLISQALAIKLNSEAISNLLTIITSGNGNLLALGTNGLAPTYDNIVALETLVDSVNHLKGSPQYLTNGKVRGKLKTTQRFASTDGGAVWKDDNTMAGYNAFSSNLVPSNLTKGTSTSVASAIVYGNFYDFKVGLWGGTEYLIDPFSAKKKGQIEITANAFWNMKAARVKSFSGIKDALTT